MAQHTDCFCKVILFFLLRVLCLSRQLPPSSVLLPEMVLSFARKDFGFQVDPEKVIGDYQGYIKSHWL